MNIWGVLQDNLDTAREILADPNADLEDKDNAGARAAELHHALNGPSGGQRRAQ